MQTLKFPYKSEWRPRAGIPNQEGFALTLLLDDKSIVDSVIEKDPITECHYIKDFTGDNFRKIVAWKKSK